MKLSILSGVNEPMMPEIDEWMLEETKKQHNVAKYKYLSQKLSRGIGNPQIRVQMVFFADLCTSE